MPAGGQDLGSDPSSGRVTENKPRGPAGLSFPSCQTKDSNTPISKDPFYSNFCQGVDLLIRQKNLPN